MSPKWSRMTEKDPKLPNTISKMISNHLKMIPNDSKWFQMIPNDSKWFQITSKWFLPCLACTCCTHSVCAHMLGLFALAQRVFTCLSSLHSFNSCSRAGASCTQSRFPFLALQVSIGIEPLATSYHYLLWGALYSSLPAALDTYHIRSFPDGGNNVRRGQQVRFSACRFQHVLLRLH